MYQPLQNKDIETSAQKNDNASSDITAATPVQVVNIRDEDAEHKVPTLLEPEDYAAIGLVESVEDLRHKTDDLYPRVKEFQKTLDKLRVDPDLNKLVNIESASTDCFTKSLSRLKQFITVFQKDLNEAISQHEQEAVAVNEAMNIGDKMEKSLDRAHHQEMSKDDAFASPKDPIIEDDVDSLFSLKK